MTAVGRDASGLDARGLRVLAAGLATAAIAGCNGSADPAAAATRASAKYASATRASATHAAATHPAAMHTAATHSATTHAAAAQKAAADMAAAPLPPTAPPRLALPDQTDEFVAADFRTFALNALLIPLLDESAPSRWLDPEIVTASSISINCVDAKASVDGRPLVPDSPVPAAAFTLRWEMNECAILNAAMRLKGTVELVVFHDGDSYSASVRPQALHLISGTVAELLSQPFAARTPL